MKSITPNTAFNIYLSYPMERDDKESLYSTIYHYNNIGIEIKAYLLDWEKMDWVDYDKKIPFPKVNLYVPSEHETFAQYAYDKKFITIDQIIAANCEVVKDCDLLIVFGEINPSACKNVIEEITYAKQEQVPIYSMPDLFPHSVEALKLAIKIILKSRG